MKYFITDSATSTLQYSGGAVTADDFDPSEAETVTLETPWQDFFDTNEFVKFTATVAQPVIQPYFYDGELQYFRKDEAELKQAQAQLDNLPWTMDHPQNDAVTSAEEIRGFWSEPTWNDGQQATLYIPAEDHEAVRYAVTNDELSVGFRGDLDWTDDPDTKEDAVQRNMVYDHVASVENGRCSSEMGCGLHNDEVHGPSDSSDGANPSRCGLHTDEDESASTHGHITETIQTQTDASPPEFTEGDIVQWQVNPDMMGEIVHNPEDQEIVMVEVYEDGPDGPTSSGFTLTAGYSDIRHADETMTDAVRTQMTEELDWSVGDFVKFTVDGDTQHGKLVMVDSERALVKEYDYDSETFADESTTIATNDLRSWVGPFTDECPGDTCSCGCHLDGQIRPSQETDSKSIPQDARTPPFDDDKHGSAPDGIYVDDGEWYGIAPSENSEDKPKYDLNTCNDVKDAYNLRNNGDYDIETSTLVARIKRAADAHDCGAMNKPWNDDEPAPNTNQSHTETNMTDLKELLTDNDITKNDVLDHYEIETKESPIEFYDGEPSAEELAEDFDTVDLLLDTKEELAEQRDALKEEVRAAKRPVFADKAEELADLTEKWGDKDTLMDRFDADEEDERLTVDDLEEKIELVEDIRDISDEETTTVDSDNTETQTDSEPDLKTTKNGRYDLRSRTKVGN